MYIYTYMYILYFVVLVNYNSSLIAYSIVEKCTENKNKLHIYYLLSFEKHSVIIDKVEVSFSSYFQLKLNSPQTDLSW